MILRQSQLQRILLIIMPSRRFRCSASLGRAVFVMSATLASAAPAWAELRVTDLAKMSLEQLSKVEVTSVSKSAEALRYAPASIYVISADEIARSGATSIAEAL